MNSILSALYNGECNPSEECMPTPQRFREKREAVVQESEAFQLTLNPQQAEEFSKILDRHLDLFLMEMEQNFLLGFRLGARVMVEVFQPDE